MARLAGGPALKRAVHVARARAGIASDAELANTAGVHYDTLMNWYAGRTVPRPAEVRKVAEALGVPYGDLLAAYDGRAPEPPALHESIERLVLELRESRRQQARILDLLAKSIGSDRRAS